MKHGSFIRLTECPKFEKLHEMNPSVVLLLAFAVGIVAGLRSMTAPATVSWAAHLNWINLHPSRLAFLGSIGAVICLTVLALAELVADKLPNTPNRITPGPLVARMVTGGFSGFALCTAANQTAAIGAILGAIGGIAGAFGGYNARRFLTKGLGAPDFLIAVLEDIIAIAGGLFLCSRI
jgi:uncharacterized membrane protein